MRRPIVFKPIYQERVWGGRTLAERFGRELPSAEVPYGESWEVSDREEAASEVLLPVELAGRTLGGLWGDAATRGEIFGEDYAGMSGRFPLLLKILDARDRLSLQVHPPAAVAGELSGEPKTEMWYIAAAEEGAELYVGLKAGVSREDFERGIAEGATEEQVHRIPASAGQFIFIPSGRLHAIGAGLLIYEIQENSDTTYRVFDWNRVGLDGRPRELHVEASLRCIDFDDVEPGMGAREGEVLVSCGEFVVEEWALGAGERRGVVRDGRFGMVTVVEGVVICGGVEFGLGDFLLVPAGMGEGDGVVEAREGGAQVLWTGLPVG
ncbi:MAG: type I phosphomannose isomerase catalytic subunit [Verrucomicrobiota bacterium]